MAQHQRGTEIRLASVLHVLWLNPRGRACTPHSLAGSAKYPNSVLGPCCQWIVTMAVDKLFIETFCPMKIAFLNNTDISGLLAIAQLFNSTNNFIQKAGKWQEKFWMSKQKFLLETLVEKKSPFWPGQILTLAHVPYPQSLNSFKTLSSSLQQSPLTDLFHSLQPICPPATMAVIQWFRRQISDEYDPKEPQSCDFIVSFTFFI